jgi:hypothetical protein
VVILRGAKEGEIWYLVEPDSWGKGIATESVNHLLDFGFGELGLHRIWATCLPENPASARVMEKVGKRKEGFLLKIHGVWKSSLLYAMLAEEWRHAPQIWHPNQGQLPDDARRVDLGQPREPQLGMHQRDAGTRREADFSSGVRRSEMEFWPYPHEQEQRMPYAKLNGRVKKI